MNGDELTLNQASNLLADRKQPGVKASWLAPHRALVRQAVEQNESFITLDGDRFKLSITTEKFHLSPMRGFVPCGWWPRSWLYEEEI